MSLESTLKYCQLPPDAEEKTESEFRDLLDSCRTAYTIPAAAFDSYKVKRGLREPDGTGVTAGVTRIGNAHGYVVNEGEKCPVDGVLEYRGYNICDLLESCIAEGRFGFEECAFLLFMGHLPTRWELQEFADVLAMLRHLPPRFTEDIIMKAPSRSIMNKLEVAVLSLYAYDDNPDDTSLENMMRQSMELVARLPVIAGQAYAVYRNTFFNKSLNLHNPRDGLSTAENFLRILRPDKSYTPEEAHLLDLCLIIHAEHGGGNASTFATRVLSSTGTDTYSAIAAGIGALKGPLHGGANIKVQEMFDCVKANVRDPHNDDELSDFLLSHPEGQGKRRIRADLRHGARGLYQVRSPRCHAQALRAPAGTGQRLRRGFRAVGIHRASDAGGFQHVQGQASRYLRQCRSLLRSGIPDAGHPDRDVHAALHHCPHGRLVCAPHGGNPVLRQDHAPRLQVHRAGTSLHGADPALSAVQAECKKHPSLIP